MNKKTISILSIFLVIIVAIGFWSFALNNSKKEPLHSPQSSTNSVTKEDPFKLNNDDDNIKAPGSSNSITASIVTSTPEDMTIVYDGKPIALEYEFTSEKPCILGLMIYINGFLQPYTVKPEQETTMHTVQLGSNDTQRFKFEFTPMCGTAGEELVVVFANVYNAKVIELSNSVNTFGNNQNISQSMPWKLKLNSNSLNIKIKTSTLYDIKEFSNKDKEKFIKVDREGNRRNLLDDRCPLEIRNNGEILNGKFIFKKDKPTELSIYVYGNYTGKYRVSLYGDFQKNPINGYDYIDIDVKKDAYTIIPLTIDFEALKIKNLYAISAPLEFKNFLEKSPSVYIIME